MRSRFMRTPGRHCCVFVWMTWFGFGTLTVCDVHALMLKVSFVGFFCTVTHYVCNSVSDKYSSTRFIIYYLHCCFCLQVFHSQSLCEKPLKPWVIIEQDGTVLTAHCNCMAGIAESCSHIAAVLFTVDASVRIRDSQTPTQVGFHFCSSVILIFSSIFF